MDGQDGQFPRYDDGPYSWIQNWFISRRLSRPFSWPTTLTILHLGPRFHGSIMDQGPWTTLHLTSTACVSISSSCIHVLNISCRLPAAAQVSPRPYQSAPISRTSRQQTQDSRELGPRSSLGFGPPRGDRGSGTLDAGAPRRRARRGRPRRAASPLPRCETGPVSVCLCVSRPADLVRAPPRGHPPATTPKRETSVRAQQSREFPETRVA